MDSDREWAPAPAAALVEQVIRSGLGWSDLIDAGLAGLERRGEDEPPPWPGEEPVHVLLEMLAGSVAVALRDVPEAALRQATELIARADRGILDDLRAAHRQAEAHQAARRRGAGRRRDTC